MEKLTAALGALVLSALIIAFAATIGGTILYFIYPHIHSMFPKAIESGVLAPELGWWNAVCISWIFNILFKSTKASTKKDK